MTTVEPTAVAAPGTAPIAEAPPTRRARWLASVAMAAAGALLLGGGFGIGFAVGAAQAPAGVGQFEEGGFPGMPGEGGAGGGPGTGGMPGGGQAPGSDGSGTTDQGADAAES